MPTTGDIKISNHPLLTPPSSTVRRSFLPSYKKYQRAASLDRNSRENSTISNHLHEFNSANKCKFEAELFNKLPRIPSYSFNPVKSRRTQNTVHDLDNGNAVLTSLRGLSDDKNISNYVRNRSPGGATESVKFDGPLRSCFDLNYVTSINNKNTPPILHVPSRYRFSSSASLSSSPSGSTNDLSRCEDGYNFNKGGVVGLRNLGNTCFMNSVIQCLANTKPLVDYCLTESYINDCNVTLSSMKGSLIKAFASLMNSVWKGGKDTVVNPQKFKKQIQKFAPRFMGYNQQDAQEFLRYLLQGLHEDINRVMIKPKSISSDIDQSLNEAQRAAEAWKGYLRVDNSKIVDLFVGQLKSCLKCTVCGHCSVTFDPFWDLSLPIPKASGLVKLQQCFDLFTKEEVLDGNEKPMCSKCGRKRKCTKNLKRFSLTERFRSKLSTLIDFPITNLDLRPYISTCSKSQPCVYDLYAVSNHSGNIYSGHYTAYCKNPYAGGWHSFNDSRVSQLPLHSIVSSEAYVLFYEINSHWSRL